MANCVDVVEKFSSSLTMKMVPQHGTKGLYYKKLRIRNLRKMDRFRSKIVYFLLLVTFTALDKHASWDKRTSLLRNQ